MLENADAESLPPDAGAMPAAGDAGMRPRQFRQLAAQWKAETAGHSSPRAITGHPAYQQIIEMGPPAVPLILQDLAENGGWWYPALRALTGANPVPESAKGRPPQNDAAWLEWGRANGCL